MGASADWRVPLAYTSAAQEVAAARSAAALADVSAFPKYSLLGPAVQAFVEASLPNTAAQRPHGVTWRVEHEALACRLTADHLLLLATSMQTDALAPHLTRAESFPGLVRQEATTAHAAFWLLGPRTEEVLAGLTALDVSPGALPQGACAETGLAAVPALLVRPPGLGVSSVLVCVGWEVGEYVWERLLGGGRVTALGHEGLRELIQQGERPA
jgi:glycine cleavage system aminomethyltransferase T